MFIYQIVETYDHQNWTACTTRGVSSLETNQATNGNVIALRSGDIKKP